MAKPMFGLKILIVEDEFMVAMTLSDMIEDAGGEVIGPVANVREARELVDQEEIDGVILHALLGSEDSLPLAEELVDRKTPVIMATGYVCELLPDALAKLPHLSKPITQTALVGAVDKHFRRA